MNRISVILGLALLFLSPAVSSARGGEALPFTRMVTDPALGGMAGAGFVSDCGAACTALGCSAGAAFSKEKGSVLASYMVAKPSGTEYVSFSGGAHLSSVVGLYVGATYGMCKPYDLYDEAGCLCGTFTPNELFGGVGLSFKIAEFLSAGVNARLASQKIAQGSSCKAFCGDIYAACRVGSFRAALGAMNLGTSVAGTDGGTYSLPSSLRLGLGFALNPDGSRSRLEVNADADYYFESGFAFAGGASYSYADYIIVRAGYRYGGATVIPSYASVGLGTRIKGFRLDAAYALPLSGSTFSGTLSVGLGWNF